MGYKPKVIALDTEGFDYVEEWSIAYRNEQGELCVEPHFGNERVDFGDTQVVFHNSKFDIRQLRKSNIKEPINVLDTMIAAYCLGMGRQAADDTGKSGDRMVGGLGLKYLARRHLGWEMEDWHENIQDPVAYNAKDSAATLLLWEKWRDQLPSHFWGIDMPLLPVLMAMEDRGIGVDKDFLAKYILKLDEELARFDLPINPDAPHDIQSYVYGTLGIEPWKFTKGGQPSVEREVLETIDDPLVKQILEYGDLYAERYRYSGDYAARIDANSRLHTEIKQTSTATGRLSSANPNLQNVKRNGELRSLFVAPEGKVLIVADASQLELRVFAAITGDPVMTKIYKEGGDIHANTARALGVDRQTGKTINFTWIYEGSAWKASQQFHIPIDQATDYLKKFYELYPTILEYHKYAKRVANEEQKVVDSWGRTRRLDAMFSNRRQVQREGEREAINAFVQMDAAEIVKLCMNDLHYKHNAPMLLQIHDELIFEVEATHALEYAQWLKEYLPTIVELKGLKFPWSVGIGPNWQDAKKHEI
jgi:DNA polymerase-1